MAVSMGITEDPFGCCHCQPFERDQEVAWVDLVHAFWVQPHASGASDRPHLDFQVRKELAQVPRELVDDVLALGEVSHRKAVEADLWDKQLEARNLGHEGPQIVTGDLGHQAVLDRELKGVGHAKTVPLSRVQILEVVSEQLRLESCWNLVRSRDLEIDRPDELIVLEEVDERCKAYDVRDCPGAAGDHAYEEYAPVLVEDRDPLEVPVHAHLSVADDVDEHDSSTRRWAATRRARRNHRRLALPDQRHRGRRTYERGSTCLPGTRRETSATGFSDGPPEVG